MRQKIVENSESGFKQLHAWILKNSTNFSENSSANSVEKTHICMEATGCYSEAVADFFYALGFKVSVVNPLRIKAFRNTKMIRQKTDSADAKLIAGAQYQPSPWIPKAPEAKLLHEIGIRIDFLKDVNVRLTNCLEKENLPELVLRSIYEERNLIEKQIKMLEAEIRNIVCDNPKLRREVLTSIKGVGEKTAFAILSDMPDVSCFQKCAQFAAFVGVTPSHKESGSSVKGASNISKIGAKRARKILYMSAVSAKRFNEHFKKFAQKLQKSRKSTKNNHRRDYAKIDVPLLRPPQK